MIYSSIILFYPYLQLQRSYRDDQGKEFDIHYNEVTIVGMASKASNFAEEFVFRNLFEKVKSFLLSICAFCYCVYIRSQHHYLDVLLMMKNLPEND
jgi:hypothetical protein